MSLVKQSCCVSSTPHCAHCWKQSLASWSHLVRAIRAVHAASALLCRVFGWAKPSPPAADVGQRDYTLWHLPDREALWPRHAESPTLAGAAFPSCSVPMRHDERAATHTAYWKSLDPTKPQLRRQQYVSMRMFACWLLKCSARQRR